MKMPGIIHRSQLAAGGMTMADIRQWQRQGLVRRAGQWYVKDEADPAVVALLVHGTRPTCSDAAVLHKLWVPIGEGVHVQRPRIGPRTPDRPRILGTSLRTAHRKTKTVSRPEPFVFHAPVVEAWPDPDPVPELDIVLQHAARCLPVLDVAILMESAMNLRQLTVPEAEGIRAGFPVRVRRALAHLSPHAESGTETKLRRWFESRRIPVRAQVNIPGVGRVDLLVGRNWVIECDSRTFHHTEQQYGEDHRRDLRLRSLGYHVTRLTWEQVFLTWEATERELMEIFRRGDHRRPLPA